MSNGDSATIEVPLRSNDNELVVDLDDLPDNPEDVMTILRDEECDLKYWLAIAVAYYKRGKVDEFMVMMQNAIRCARCVHKRTQQATLCAVASYYTARYYAEAPEERAKCLEKANAPIAQAEKVDLNTPVVWISKGMLFLLRSNYDQARLNFELYLSKIAGSIPAHIGLACASMGKEDWTAALKAWQQCLRLMAGKKTIKLSVQSMVRCGIGLCFDKLDCHNTAKIAFERVLDIDPSNPTALVLLSTISLNAMKHPATSEGDKREFLAMGVNYATKAFHEMKARNETNAIVLARIGDILFLQQHYDKSMTAVVKASDHTSSAAMLAEVHYLLGRGHHVQRNYTEATTEYSRSLSYKSDYLLSSYAMGQMYLQRGDTSKALECLEYVRDKVRVLKKNDARSMELPRPSTIGGVNLDEDYDTLKKLGFLYAQQAEIPIEVTFNMPTSEYKQKREQSRQLYEKALEIFKTLYQFRSTDPSETGSQDPHVLIMYARMLERSPSVTIVDRNQALQLYMLALKALTADGRIVARPELTINIGVLYHTLNDLERAKSYYYAALTETRALDESTLPHIKDTLETTILYNNARLLEDLQSDAEAEKFHKGVLAKHPYFHDSQLRLGSIAQARGQLQEAADSYELVLQRDPSNVEAYCLLGALQLTQEQARAAKRNFEKVLNTIDKFDITSLLQLANLYLFGSVGKKDGEEKSKNLTEAWKVFDKVLQLDPRNPWAVNGIAIALREKGWTEEALLLFEQVREADLEVPYFTINYAHMLTEMQQYQRAIRLYEKASERFYENKNVEILTWIARAYYLFGKTSKSAEHLRHAMRYLQKALHIFPKDRTLLFNLSVVQQDHTVILAGERMDKVAIDEMRVAVKHATLAIRNFTILSQVTSDQYDHSIAAQRASFTSTLKDKLLKRIDEAIKTEKDREKRLEIMRRELRQNVEDKESNQRTEKEEQRREQQRMAHEYEVFNEKVKSSLRAWDEFQTIETKTQRRRKKDEDGFAGREGGISSSSDSEIEGIDGASKRKRDLEGVLVKKEKKRKVARKSSIEDDGLGDEEGYSHGVGSSSMTSSHRRRQPAADDHIADSDEELRE